MSNESRPADFLEWSELRATDRLFTAVAKRFEGKPLTDDERRILAAWDQQGLAIAEGIADARE